eukprot:COSAG02_NODE_24827_length_676_cov_1.275563_1_plen_31_part_01
MVTGAPRARTETNFARVRAPAHAFIKVGGMK